MTADDKLRQPQATPIVLCPWLVVVAGLVVFGLTLNHWVSLASLPLVAQITGWDWHPLPLAWRPEPIRPLYFLITLPVRILPVLWQPGSLNVVAAVCAALTLGLLARSVRLLPQDRTREQRQREHGEFALLSVRAAFLPALFAVLMLAGQINFWQNAVAASSDMLDLLVFAFLIFCLLEFRVCQNDQWLGAMAFVYGLGTANNWALIGFFPLFLIALIWIKGLGFFNWPFVARMLKCGSAGLVLYLLVPLLGSVGGEHQSFWFLLHQELSAQSYGLRAVPRWMVILAAMSTVLPLVFAGVRWPAYEGEISPMGNVVIRLMLRGLHVLFLLLALILFFDFRYSPGLRMREMPIGFLSFYYLAALAIGYFSGYLLLLFGRNAAQEQERPNPVAKVCRDLMVGMVWLLAAAAPAWLFWQHFPRIQAGNSAALAQFAEELAKGLPSKGAIVLSDDSSRLFLLEAACQRRGAPNQNLLIETPSLPHRQYIQFLASRSPDIRDIVAGQKTSRQALSAESLVNLLLQAGQRQPIYYLHPSFGYYFEVFYLEPRGIVYEMKPFASSAAQPPLPSEAEIAANQAFWARLDQGPLPSLPNLARMDGGAQAVASDYSVALDFWGVQLQRANRLKEANASFAEAVRIKPDNYIARINLEYNTHLQKGDHRPINSTELIHRAMNFYGGLVRVLIFNGPMDEPDLDLQLGQTLAASKNLRQATALFERRSELLPGDALAELALAKTYVDRGMGGKALETLRAIRDTSRINPWELTRAKALALVANKEYSAAEKILRDAVQASPKDPSRIALLGEFYRVAGDAALRQKQEAEARRYFNNSLANLNLQMELLAPPVEGNNPSREVVELLLQKAEVQMLLKSYEAVMATVNQCLQIQPSNPMAHLIRGVAQIQLKKTQEAKKEYMLLRKLLPNEPYVVDYGLADVAEAEKDTAEEMRCLERYLNSAPDDTAEYNQVKKRLQKLGGHAKGN